MYAAAGLAVASSLALVTGLHVSLRWHNRAVASISAVALAVLLVFLFRYHGTWQVARWLPFSNAIVLGNLIPIGGAFFAGIILAQDVTPKWRRLSLVSLILMASGYSVACCFLGLLPATHMMGRPTTVVVQGQRSSCGACCAAMLLQHHGIDATEEEMVRLCLTSHRGCPALGVYRGLKLKTVDTDWDVEVVTCPVEELSRADAPLLLRIWLPKSRVIDSRGRIHGSWRRTEHAVILVGPAAGEGFQLVDPALGIDQRVVWSVDCLRDHWPGEALRLVRRPE
jgi:hypothetical protein